MTIREWLDSGRDYAQGVDLYEVHGTSDVVRKLLAFGETAFTRSKLARELEQLAPAAAPTTPVVAPTTPQAAPTTVAAPDPQRREWFAERNHLHAQLGLVATDEQRRVMALRILELARLIERSYDQAPEPTPAGQASAELQALDDEGEIRRLLANLRPQRTKLKKRPDRANDLATVEASIHLLELKLKRDGRKPQL